MIKLIWDQTKHSWKNWLSMITLFLVAGVFISYCTTGAFSVQSKEGVDSASLETFFLVPMFLGSMTIIIVTKGAIDLLINNFRSEYSLWTILGANPRQLALVVGSQLAVIGFIGSLIGFLVNLITMPFLYDCSQKLLGSGLPDITFHFYISSLILTLLVGSLLAGISGFIHARKIFIHSQKDILAFQQSNLKQKNSLLKWIIFLIFIGLTIYFWMQVSNVTTINGTPFYIPFIVVLIIAFNLFFALMSTSILEKVAQFLPKQNHAHLVVALWQVIENKSFLLALIIPLVTGITLLSGITTLVVSVFHQPSNELFADLILFVGAPMLMICTNIVVITIITEQREREQQALLNVLGLSTTDQLIVKFYKSIIYVLTMLVCSLTLSSILGIMLQHTSIQMGSGAFNWTPIFISPICMSVVTLIVLFFINIFQLNKVTV
jgi:hypothetical protein